MDLSGERVRWISELHKSSNDLGGTRAKVIEISGNGVQMTRILIRFSEAVAHKCRDFQVEQFFLHLSLSSTWKPGRWRVRGERHGCCQQTTTTRRVASEQIYHLEH